MIRPGGRVVRDHLPFAPFDELTDAAESGSLFTARPPESTRVRTGLPFVRLVRYVLSS